MPSTTHPTVIYEMHIFKDVDNTSWTSPQVYTFQLSAGAAVPVIRNNGSKGGLLNLRRCSPQQLAFLQSHLDAKNASLRSAREAEIETKKMKDAHQKKEAQKQQKKYVEKMKLRMEVEEEEGSEMKGQNEGQESEETRNPIIIPAPTTFSARRPPVVYQPYGYHSGGGSAPIHIHGTYDNPLSSPPPPPPPPPRGFYPPPHYRHKRREKPTPLQLESDWELESIDLDLIPIVAKLKIKQLKTSSLGLERTQDNYYDYTRRRKGNRMSRLAYQLADSAKVEFAVVYGRTVMTTVPNRQVVRDMVSYGGESEVDDESVYEFDSEDDMAEVTIGKEEGEEEEEEEEEEDLEVVEGFGHCHPVTESMSKCCLEGRC